MTRLLKLLEMKTALGEYVVCALLGVSGLRLAILWEYLPNPQDAVKAFIVGLISAFAGLLLRWVWGKLEKWRNQ